MAMPIVLAGHVVAVLYSDQGHGDHLRERSRATLEILARHAAARLEGVTALRSAQLLNHWPDGLTPFSAPVVSDIEPMPGNGDMKGVFADHGDAADDEQAARRYARLLLSEIRLYHESDVLAGRQARDLAVRLGGEIARARALYEERVPMHVRLGADHFHAELVNTLANGDPSLL
jgi:hypothetical protein